MKKTIQTLVFVAGAALFSGCAHMHAVDGPQEKSEIPAGVRVSIGATEIKEGDTVNVFRSVCKKVTATRAGQRTACTNEKIGEAQVLKVLDHDSAIVQPQQGLTMDANMKVEKK